MREGLHDLRSLLKDTLRRSELETPLKEHICVMVWDEVVGSQVANAARPEFVRDGILFVSTKSSVWSNELTMYKGDILSRLNQRAGGAVLKEIIFKVGKVERKKKPAASDNKDKPGLEGINLSDDEIKRIESIAATTSDEVCESFTNMMATWAKLEKWKRQNGWSPCRKCGSLQRAPNGICPVCENSG